MEAKATVDILVHLHGFRNVELHSRGVYAVRVSTGLINEARASQWKNASNLDDVIKAVPYEFFSRASKQNTFVREQSIKQSSSIGLPEAHIVEESSKFQTRAFVIKYRDEYLELNEGVRFQMAVPIDLNETQQLGLNGLDRPLVNDVAGRALFTRKCFKLRVELIMAELEDWKNEKKPIDNPAEYDFEFTGVAEQEFIIAVDNTWSVHEYIPATINDQNFCQIDMTVHSALMNLKFRRLRKKSASRNGSLPPTRRASKKSKDGMESEITRLHKIYTEPILNSIDDVFKDYHWLQNECSTEDSREEDVELSKKTSLNEMPPFTTLRSVDSIINSRSSYRLSASDVVLKGIDADMQESAKYIFNLWSFFITKIPEVHEKVCTTLQPLWLSNHRQWWCSRSDVTSKRLQTILKGEAYASAAQTAMTLRKLKRELSACALRVCDRELLRHEENLPVCNTYRYVSVAEMKANSDMGHLGKLPAELDGTGMFNFRVSPTNMMGRKDPQQPGPHIFVLHHGFHGSSFDMRLIGSYLRLLFPHAIVLPAQSNEDHPGLSIAEMGARLASELRTWIMLKFPRLGIAYCGGRLSFVGHSVGAIVIRSALMSPLLKPFVSKFHCFVSLGSPHLGTTYFNSALVSGALWALKRFRRSPLLEELQMLDAATPEETFMFKLSKDRSLSLFKHVILVSGHQDQYVPLHSALIHVPSDAEKDMDGGPILIAMAANIMSTIDASTVIRVNFDYIFEHITMDTLIGRAAHINILESHSILQLLFFCLYQYLT